MGHPPVLSCPKHIRRLVNSLRTWLWILTCGQLFGSFIIRDHQQLSQFKWMISISKFARRWTIWRWVPVDHHPHLSHIEYVVMVQIHPRTNTLRTNRKRLIIWGIGTEIPILTHTIPIGRIVQIWNRESTKEETLFKINQLLLINHLIWLNLRSMNRGIQLMSQLPLSWKKRWIHWGVACEN